MENVNTVPRRQVFACRGKSLMDVLSNIRTYSDAMDVQPRLVTCLRNAKQDTLGDFVDLSEQGESVTQGY